MATLKDCFTQDEWFQLMEAKEMIGDLPVDLNVIHKNNPKATTYKLSFGNTELNGSGFQVATNLWPDTEAILRNHFNIKEKSK